MTDKYTDKFTEAEKELEENSAYVCEGCNKKYGKQEAAKMNNTCCGRSMRELLQESFGP